MGSLVPEHDQRALPEQAIGAEKSHDQCEAHRQPQPDEQHSRVQRRSEERRVGKECRL